MEENVENEEKDVTESPSAENVPMFRSAGSAPATEEESWPIFLDESAPDFWEGF
ncbi:MAG: hypothetical protein HDS65_06435 [Bacteroidales bacterium]|nr:hypothetical protein [Bacteroidales bacterium]